MKKQRGPPEKKGENNMTAVLEKQKQQEQEDKKEAMRYMVSIMNKLDYGSMMQLQGGAHMLLARQQLEEKK